MALRRGHTGRKGATRLMWDGIDQQLEYGACLIRSASPILYHPDGQTPGEMTRADMGSVLGDFTAAAQRGLRVCFDLLELRCAHGYLLASFLSPLTNHRTDDYGGSARNRLRFTLDVFIALRTRWPVDKSMSFCLSVFDWADGGTTEADLITIARAFADAGCDLIDVSTGQTVADSAPQYGRMLQVPWSDMLRQQVGIATMCVGNITKAAQANTILVAGRADLVSLARPHRTDPAFTPLAAAQYGVADVACPPQYAPGRDALMRNTAREREELMELERKARAHGHSSP